MATMEEATVAQVGDLKDGEMKAVMVGDANVLLTRIGNAYHAIGAVCTHQGGPLAEGLLRSDIVMCPWHHACFRVTTGERLEPPALEPEPCYPVRVEGTSVIVSVPAGKAAAAPGAGRAGRPQGARDARVFAIVGGGAAGYAAADLLRASGFAGRVVLITREQDLPYDRTLLSKDFLAGSAQTENLSLRDECFYADAEIEILRDRAVASVEPSQRRLTFADSESLTYDALLLATGGEPRPLPVPGADLQHVYLLRSERDARRIVARAASAQRAVVIGAGFIGMETAASLTKRGLKVTVLAPGTVPFEKTFGREIGEMIRAHHEVNGVTFRLGRRVARLEGSGAVESVVLDSGERLPADLVIAGLGVRPATSCLLGVPLLPDGSVRVDDHMRVTDGLYAAGDIAAFPLPATGELARVEHWRVAEQQGRAAARAMLGLDMPYRDVPFFWSNQFDLALCSVGYAGDWDEMLFWGDVAKLEFVAFYVKDGRVTAAAGNYRDRDMLAIEQLLWTDRMPGPDALRGREQNLVALVPSDAGRIP